MQQYVNENQDAFFSNGRLRNEEFVSNFLHQYSEPSIGWQTAQTKRKSWLKKANIKRVNETKQATRKEKGKESLEGSNMWL